MKRRRRIKTGPSYGILEQRQLLATTGLAQFDGDASIDTGLIVNGNFDGIDVADGTAAQVNATAVPGWSQTDGASDIVSLVGFDDSPRGTGFHVDFRPDVLESLFQDVDTEDGQLYTLAFDMLGRTVADTADATTNDIRILWDGAEVGTYRGITDFWQSFTVDVAGGSSDLTRLEIQEVDGAGNDGIGAMLDNVRLVPVSSQAIVNGSFEDNGSGAISQDDLPGWSVVGAKADRIFDVRDGTGSNGARFLNVDRLDSNSDILFTDVPTESGGVYFVSFDLRSESGVVGENEEMRIRWNDEWVGTYRGNADWQSFGFSVRADSDSTRLVFREPGNSFTGDGVGPLLDNVRIMKVVPTIGLSLTDNAAFEFTENGAAVDLGARVEAATSTVDDAVTGATVTLPSTADLATESLTVEITENGTPTTQRSENGTLTISGNRTLQEYVDILKTLNYENTSDNPTADSRAITIQLNAVDASSPAVTMTVNVTPVNDAPVVAAIVDADAKVGEEFTVQATATDPENDTVVWSVSALGTAIESTDTQPTVDDQGNVSWTPARAGEAVLTVRGTDSGALFSEQQFTLTVTEDVTLDTGTVTVNSGTDLPLFDSSAATDAAIGQTIADFEAQTINGEAFNSITPNVARIYSVLAHWCPFCQQELPEISDWLMDNDLGDDVEFVAAAVAVDSTRDNYPPADWFDTEEFSGTIIVDNSQAKLMDIFGTQSFPFLVAVDASGTVVERFSGVTTRAQLDLALASVRGSN